MIFRYTILYVADVGASMQFYSDAFGLSELMLHPSGQYGELATGPTKLAFCALELAQSNLDHTPAAPDSERPSFEIAFESDNVADAFAHAVRAGATPVKTPQAMPWGQTVSYVRDLNGFLVEICSPITPQS